MTADNPGPKPRRNALTMTGTSRGTYAYSRGFTPSVSIAMKQRTTSDIAKVNRIQTDRSRNRLIDSGNSTQPKVMSMGGASKQISISKTIQEGCPVSSASSAKRNPQAAPTNVQSQRNET